MAIMGVSHGLFREIIRLLAAWAIS